MHTYCNPNKCTNLSVSFHPSLHRISPRYRPEQTPPPACAVQRIGTVHTIRTLSSTPRRRRRPISLRPRPSPPLPMAADLPPFACPHCTSRFGKALKLDRHLLDVHHASLRLSPSPDSLPPRLSRHLARAVAEANAAFDCAAPFCARCPPSAQAKPFRNVRDLAQHLLGKHPDDDMPPARNPPPPDSEISCKRKREHHPALTAAYVEDSSPDRKRRRSPPQNPAPNAPNAPNAPDAEKDAVAPVAAPVPKRRDSTLKSDRPTTPSPSARRHEVPPKTVTPNKPPKPVPVPACVPPVSPYLPNGPIGLPPNALVTTAPMNFSGFAGFAPLSGKSYYRLSER